MRSKKVQDFTDRFVADRLLLKVASRCNLTCDYCYWFKDPEVLSAPARMTSEVEAHFLRRLEDHLAFYNPRFFSVSLHGGEPLLFGKERFSSLCYQLRSIECRTKTRINIACQTNGVLIDKQWADLLRLYNVNVGVSLDGPRRIHDRSRRDHCGHGSFDRVVKGIQILQENELSPGILAVWSAESDAHEICSFLVGELGIDWFDVLMPDITREESAADISSFYITLFNEWFYNLYSRGVFVRSAANFARVLMGLQSFSESLGAAPTTTFSVSTGGNLEVLDVFNIISPGFAGTGLNLRDSNIQDIAQSEKWLLQVDASTSLAPKCKSCRFSTTCGGGYLPSRYSGDRQFDNESAYCRSLYAILEHVSSVLFQEAVKLSNRVRREQMPTPTPTA